MPQRRRDEQPIRPHLDRARVDLQDGEQIAEYGERISEAVTRQSSEMRGENILKEGQDAYV